jgi:hypothetical protein
MLGDFIAKIADGRRSVQWRILKKKSCR